MLVICYKFGKLEKKKQNKLGNRHQQTCVSMAYDQARLTTYTENLSISLLAVQGKVTVS